MKLKKRRGSTFTEIIIGFVILSMIVVIVCGVVTSSYTLSARLEDLPNTYYAAQDEVEHELETLKGLVTEKYRIENEMRNAAEEDIPEDLPERLSDVEEELEDYHSDTVTLFGKSVDVYDFYIEHESDDGLNLSLYAGVANSEPMERPVPIIDEVSVIPLGESLSPEMYDAVGKTLRADVAYNSKNESYFFKSMYQWYVCTGDFHTSAYTDDGGFEELLYGTVFAQYPNDFTLIAGADQQTINVDSSYNGKFLACVVTPLSIEGKMGQSVLSNFVYISALPKLSRGSYDLLIEPSLMPTAYDASESISLSEIRSRTGSAKLTLYGASRASLDLNGAVTDSGYSPDAEQNWHYSRFISIESGSWLKASGLPAPRGGGTCYAVVRNLEPEPFNFIYVRGAYAGFEDNADIYGSGGADWHIVVCPVSTYTDFMIGGGLDVAELILASGGADPGAIIGYLSAKYHIDAVLQES